LKIFPKSKNDVWEIKNKKKTDKGQGIVFPLQPWDLTMTLSLQGIAIEQVRRLVPLFIFLLLLFQV
jgi:hypothetical protein